MSDPTQERTPEEIRAEIAETRQELGDTVEALAHKTDVKAQVHERVEEVKADVREKVEDVKEKVTGAVGSAAQASDDPYSAPNQALKATNRNPAAVAAAGIAIGIVALWLIRRRR